MHKLSLGLALLGLSAVFAVQAAPEDPAAAPSAPAAAAAPALEDQTAPAEPDAPSEPVRDQNGFYIGGPVYVSDQNMVWVRSGPGTNYRIIGSRAIGTELTLRAYSRDGSFAQVEDAEGNTFWMGTKTLQADSCGKVREQELLARIGSLEDQLKNYDSALKRQADAATQRSERLERENAGMQQAIAQKDKTIEELDELRRDYEDRLQTKELDMQMRWWLQGAIIAFCGAVAGIIFVYLPRPTRKSRRERF